MAEERHVVNVERVGSAVNGWAVLLPDLAAIGALAVLIVLKKPEGWPLFWILLAIVVAAFQLIGLFSLQPNEARVLILFGEYKGTVRTSGFWWANPLYSGSRPGASGILTAGLENKKPRRTRAASLGRNKISLRARTLNGDHLKVNDKRGNPIEIAAVVVWRISDTAQAFFDVDDYENYVPVQSESALRHIANLYSYDDGEGTETTLRSNPEEVSEALRAELQERLAKAGVVVDEARLTHLAYAPEIALVMLRRQQA